MMSRTSICIFLIAALFLFAHGSEFQRFSLNQGHINLRNLATADSSSAGEAYPLLKHGENTAITVDLGEEYLSRNDMPSQTQTSMLILLHSNVTGFCRDCARFKKYNCDDNSCKADMTIQQSFLSPYSSWAKANPIKQSVSIGNSTTAPAWKLSNNASLFNASYWNYEFIRTPSGYTPEITNFDTYGFLGLGVGGGAASNFHGDHPLFSVSLNSTGNGQLIFGKDSSLYDASTTHITLTTDTNWTMVTKNMTFGPNYSNTSYVSKLVFDLQNAYISIPAGYYSDSGNSKDFLKALRSIPKMDNVHTEDSFYTFTGDLNELPNFVIGLENGQSISIPPAGYTRKSEFKNNTFVILISYLNPVVNMTDEEKVNYTVLGWHALSQFYTIFEQKSGSEPTLTLYPVKTSSNNNSENTPAPFAHRVIQLALVVFLIVAIIACLKNRAASKLKNELNEELNTSISAF